ncbi:arginine--tRNA ligase [Aureimonas endophytica]|uniref:Arginine--tRNA ligase n=2 Tax=Aureimonas endophytica TaxID=2027858 RepID=A0A917DZC7_9HYPH|nr:arginine--tRNA ligase [Aureimonas endophytica]
MPISDPLETLMNIFADFETRIRKAVGAVLGTDAPDLSRIAVEPPRDAGHGDLSTNAAMVLAKPLGRKPRELGETFAEALRGNADVEAVEVAGPGFINLRLKPAYWTNHLAEVLERGLDYGRAAPTGRRINVEYVSANPTGPMHVGHCRGAVVGDSIANLLAFAGAEVVKEYYINDAGEQVNVLARSVFLRYREALGETIGEIPAGLYPGDYLKPVGAALALTRRDELKRMDEAEWLPIVRDYAINAMMMMIRDDLKRLGIEHEVFFSERSLHARNGGNASRIAETVAALQERGIVYQGTLPPPKGQLPEDWEDREQTLLRSTEVGDDMDRPLVKSNGSYTYFAADVAYFADKFARGFDEMVYVLGADHGGYVKRLEAVAKAVSAGRAEASVVLCQLVKLYRDGEPVKMSKRSGDFVTLAEVVEEVGRDPVRFMMLYRKSDAPLDFDFAKVTEQSKDNPVFYVQYAHARAASVFRQAQGAGIEVPADAALADRERLALLADEGEIGLIRKLAEYPRLVLAAAEAKEPHRVAFYLYDLAQLFHAQYNRGRDVPGLRFVNPDEPRLTLARLGLVRGVASVVASGLKLIGADAPDEMR